MSKRTFDVWVTRDWNVTRSEIHVGKPWFSQNSGCWFETGAGYATDICDKEMYKRLGIRPQKGGDKAIRKYRMTVTLERVKEEKE